jgi:hypothetical protein
MEKQAGDYTSSISWAANYHITAGRLEIFTARGDTLVYKPSEPVTDYSTLLSNLGTSNVPVTEGEELSQPFLSGKGRIINVNGSSIQVFEYDTPTAMEAESKHVSSDGTDIRGYSVDWIGPPHFYKAGRIIVIYIGKDETITALLEKTLGKQFAGS